MCAYFSKKKLKIYQQGSIKLHKPNIFLCLPAGKSLKEVNRVYPSTTKNAFINQSLHTMPLHTSDDDINTDDEFVQNWSDVASPRIQKQQQQQKKKSKSLSRLDSAPKYIQRERALDQAVSHTGLASVASTPDGDSARPLSDYENEASSILFEPITPLSMQTSLFSSQNLQFNDSVLGGAGAGGIDNDSTADMRRDSNPTSSPIKIKSSNGHNSTPMQPVKGFQAMRNSLDQILLNSPTSSTPVGVGNSTTDTPRSNNNTAPAAPPRRSKIGGKSTSGALNSPSANNSPKIQNAIEPKFTHNL